MTAHVGDAIEWTNADFVAHTATAKNKDWDVQLPPNKTGRVTVKKTGTAEALGLRDATVRKGRWPLVIYSHGTCGTPAEASYLTKAIAASTP